MNQKPKNNTTDFVKVQDIRDSVVILKNGTIQAVVEVGSINFDLKSDDEQTALIQAFQNFLNSSDFPIQIMVESRRLEIKNYIENLDSQIENIDNELLRIQAVEYKRFIIGLTELANIMTKSFFVVVPFYITESKSSNKGLLETAKSIFRTSKVMKKMDDDEFENYKNQIMQRVDLIISGLSGMGLSPKVLDDSKLKEKFLSYYND